MDTDLGKHRLEKLTRPPAPGSKDAAAKPLQSDLSRIEQALSRMARGDYGYCIYCGGEMTLDSLERDPAADVCDGCRST